MEKCQVLSLNAGARRRKSKQELPCFSALIADGVVHLPAQRHQAKVVDLNAVRCAKEKAETDLL